MANSNRTLQQWVDYIQTLHHRQIDLSLDRVRAVYQRLINDKPNFTVISIAGTNGKGSTAEMLSSIYCCAGYRVGKYTSPHLIRFNERYLINDVAVSDERLLAAFEKTESVRGEIPITFFEFGTLLAIELFNAAEVEIAVMEVGLGGRKDAVNILDADVAIVTSISLDHTAWLGNNTDDISYEKIGIARPHKPCIIGVVEPSQRMIDYCQLIQAKPLFVDQDFAYQQQADELWQWQNKQVCYQNLPWPFEQADVQLSNASLAVQAIECLQAEHPINVAQLRDGFVQSSLLGRCQILSVKPLIILDVAHNVSSVQRLFDFVRARLNVGRKTEVICGMLNDKDIAASLELLSPIVRHWHLVTIDHERGAANDELASIVRTLDQTAEVSLYDSARSAYQHLLNSVKNDDTLVVFGSFFIAGDILALLSET